MALYDFITPSTPLVHTDLPEPHDDIIISCIANILCVLLPVLHINLCQTSHQVLGDSGSGPPQERDMLAHLQFSLIKHLDQVGWDDIREPLVPPQNGHQWSLDKVCHKTYLHEGIHLIFHSAHKSPGHHKAEGRGIATVSPTHHKPTHYLLYIFSLVLFCHRNVPAIRLEVVLQLKRCVSITM